MLLRAIKFAPHLFFLSQHSGTFNWRNLASARLLFTGHSRSGKKAYKSWSVSVPIENQINCILERF